MTQQRSPVSGDRGAPPIPLHNRHHEKHGAMKPIIDAAWHHFVKVAELGAVSRAAVAADVPQSVVSRYIAQIEADMGSPLFRRTGRGVVLTELGQQMYPRIKHLIAET